MDGGSAASLGRTLDAAMRDDGSALLGKVRPARSVD